jgi:hypothetical protein
MRDTFMVAGGDAELFRVNYFRSTRWMVNLQQTTAPGARAGAVAAIENAEGERPQARSARACGPVCPVGRGSYELP